MINEILLILVVIAVVYFLFMKKPAVKGAKKSEEKEQKSEDLVACHRCGTYSSISDSIIKGGEYYCSTECLNGK